MGIGLKLSFPIVLSHRSHLIKLFIMLLGKLVHLGFINMIDVISESDRCKDLILDLCLLFFTLPPTRLLLHKSCMHHRSRAVSFSSASPSSAPRLTPTTSAAVQPHPPPLPVRRLASLVHFRWRCHEKTVPVRAPRVLTGDRPLVIIVVSLW